MPPTVLFHGEDAGDTYFFWQWTGDLQDEPHTHVIRKDVLAPLLATLDAALPGIEGEPDEVMKDRVLGSGVFAKYSTEAAFTQQLSRVVLPRELGESIVRVFGAHGRVRLRTLAAPSCARIPWELLWVTTPDGEERRLLDYADIVSDPPAGIHAERAVTPRAWTAEYADEPVLYVVDPNNGGDFVLHSAQRGRFVRRNPIEGSPLPGQKFGRALLSRLLNRAPLPARLFYLGHVASSSSQPGATSLMLSDDKTMFGVTELIGAIRPFSAFDAVEGTLHWDERVRELRRIDPDLDPQSPTGDTAGRAGWEIWPMPPRVALIACNSGGDLGHPEPFGLVIAFLNSGAELVTATRWPLPTDAAFRVDPREFDEKVHPQPLLRMAERIDKEHAGADPAAGIADWQREQLREWTERGETNVASTPVLWAAVTTYLGTFKPTRQLAPGELGLAF